MLYINTTLIDSFLCFVIISSTSLSLIRPRATLSRSLEGRALGVYLAEVGAEFLGEAFDDFGVAGAEVVLFADVGGSANSGILICPNPDILLAISPLPLIRAFI